MHQLAELLILLRYEGVVVGHGLGAGDGGHYAQKGSVIVVVHRRLLHPLRPQPPSSDIPYL